TILKMISYAGAGPQVRIPRADGSAEHGLRRPPMAKNARGPLGHFAGKRWPQRSEGDVLFPIFDHDPRRRMTWDHWFASVWISSPQLRQRRAAALSGPRVRRTGPRHCGERALAP